MAHRHLKAVTETPPADHWRTALAVAIQKRDAAQTKLDAASAAFESARRIGWTLGDKLKAAQKEVELASAREARVLVAKHMQQEPEKGLTVAGAEAAVKAIEKEISDNARLREQLGRLVEEAEKAVRWRTTEAENAISDFLKNSDALATLIEDLTTSDRTSARLRFVLKALPPAALPMWNADQSLIGDHEWEQLRDLEKKWTEAIRTLAVDPNVALPTP
jgi:hypothetical protein